MYFTPRTVRSCAGLYPHLPLYPRTWSVLRFLHFLLCLANGSFTFSSRTRCLARRSACLSPCDENARVSYHESRFISRQALEVVFSFLILFLFSFRDLRRDDKPKVKYRADLNRCDDALDLIANNTRCA